MKFKTSTVEVKSKPKLFGLTNVFKPFVFVNSIIFLSSELTQISLALKLFNA